LESATAECLELARLYEARGEMGKASEFMAEAQQMNPLLEPPQGDEWSVGHQPAGHDYEVPIAAASQNNGSSFELRELTGGLDLSRYQTGALGDNMGFVMAPGDALKSSQARTAADSAARSHSSLGADGAHAGVEPGPPPRMSPGQEAGESPVFTGTGNIHSDTVSRILLDE